jgi:hypothetical protein
MIKFEYKIELEQPMSQTELLVEIYEVGSGWPMAVEILTVSNYLWPAMTSLMQPIINCYLDLVSDYYRLKVYEAKQHVENSPHP